jgi:hypothetical protein
LERQKPAGMAGYGKEAGKILSARREEVIYIGRVRKAFFAKDYTIAIVRVPLPGT